MYIPAHFAQDDPALLLEVMQRHSFATLVCTVDGEPFATHLPLRAEQTAQGWRIEGHMARANGQWQALESGARALAIFHGPHAYVSPSQYQSLDRVPTWNYIAVHARGTIRTCHERDAKVEMLHRLIAQYEPGYRAQFDAVDARLRETMLGAIVGFTMDVDRLEGKFKLNQHRIAELRPEVQARHENGSADEREIAGWLKRLGLWQD